MRNVRDAVCILTLILSSVACQSLENERTGVELRELYAGNQCTPENATLIQPDNSTEAMSLIGRNRFIGAQPTVPAVDNDNELILLVAAGRKPGAGYQLQLEQRHAELHDGVLYLPVTLSTPAGDRQAAMITSPCLLLAVERGRYQRVVVENMGLQLDLVAQ